MTKPLIIEVPRAWFAKYTIPCDWGRPLRPEQIIIEDDAMKAEALVIVGWVVFPERGTAKEYIVGTVIRQRVNGHIQELCSHEHVYIKRLPGRRVASVRQFEGPFEVKVIN